MFANGSTGQMRVTALELCSEKLCIDELHTCSRVTGNSLHILFYSYSNIYMYFAINCVWLIACTLCTHYLVIAVSPKNLENQMNTYIFKIYFPKSAAYICMYIHMRIDLHVCYLCAIIAL